MIIKPLKRRLVLKGNYNDPKSIRCEWTGKSTQEIQNETIEEQRKETRTEPAIPELSPWDDPKRKAIVDLIREYGIEAIEGPTDFFMARTYALDELARDILDDDEREQDWVNVLSPIEMAMVKSKQREMLELYEKFWSWKGMRSIKEKRNIRELKGRKKAAYEHFARPNGWHQDWKKQRWSNLRPNDYEDEILEELLYDQRERNPRKELKTNEVIIPKT